MKDKLKYLVINTSEENLTILNLYEDKLIDSFEDTSIRSHLKNLIPQIKNIIERNNLIIKDLDFIAINEGPGSWTGLRIGFATVKVLAMVNKIKVITFNNFDLILKKNKVTNGVILIKCSEVNYYFREINEGSLVSEGIISESNLLEKYSNSEKYYLEGGSSKTINDTVIEKYNSKNFSNINDLEPNYISEGLIISKFKKND